VTSFDLRFTRPNFEPVMNTAEVHAIEHLGATYLRNHPELGEKVLYFGPMGCRTGFYLLLGGEYEPADITGLLNGMCRYMIAFDGEIPGASARDCGNYLDMNLPMAKFYAGRFLYEVLLNLSERNTVYPKE
jgi:S-ribosylhomocysteine lyase